MIIVGAGLSGLLAGALDRHATIIERQADLPNNHHAVLRFRDDKISRSLDIPFRKVRVVKAIADVDGVHAVALPHHLNGYARKALGILTTRSILDLSPVERFVAPHNLVERLGEMCQGRIVFNSALSHSDIGKEPIISTIPLPALWELLQRTDAPEFTSAPIRVLKFRLPDADIFQTIYFPDADIPLYRATITRDEVILECSDKMGGLTESQLDFAMRAFGIDYKTLIPKEIRRQGLGKIQPINEAERKGLLYKLTRDHKIYSLGRFACWRNILMDDVYDDYWKVKKMIALNEYDHVRAVI